MKYILFGDKSLDAFVAAMLAYYKCLYDGDSQIVVLPFSRIDPIPTFSYGDTVILLGVGLSPSKVEHLVYDVGVNVIIVEHHSEFVNEIGYTFVDWHNLPYFFLMDNLEHDIFDKLTFEEKHSKVGWRYYFSNNDFPNKPQETKRSSAGIVKDVLMKNTPDIEGFLKTFMRCDFHKLVETSQDHELWFHHGNERADSYLLNQWFKHWYNEYRDCFIRMKENYLTPNDQFLELKSRFIITSLEEKIEFGRQQLMKTKTKTRELASSSAVKKVKFRHYDIRDMKTCYVDSPLVSVLGESIVGNELVKEHGWDVVILDGPKQSSLKAYSLYSNPDGADIDVLQICRLFHETGAAVSKSGRRNAAVIEFNLGEEDIFFEKL